MDTHAERSAIVTGGGSGIGRAVAVALAAAGSKVAVLDISETAAQATCDIIRSQGGTSLAVQCDVASLDDQYAAVSKVLAEFGSLHIACNNAGISGAAGGDYSLLADVPRESWQRMLDVNLTGVFLGMKAQIPAMLASGGGSIVNVASVMGQVARRGLGAYVAAKHGVVGVTRAAAIDYADRNVRVNAIGPGYIDTPMLSGKDPTVLQGLAAIHPMGRLGRPDEVAALVVWLTGSSSSFVTGAYYPVDGGYLSQ